MGGHPPFEIIGYGPMFKFPTEFGDARDSIQFCSGMTIHEDFISLYYGVSDCIAKIITVRISDLLHNSFIVIPRRNDECI